MGKWGKLGHELAPVGDAGTSKARPSATVVLLSKELQQGRRRQALHPLTPSVALLPRAALAQASSFILAFAWVAGPRPSGALWHGKWSIAGGIRAVGVWVTCCVMMPAPGG